jgi:putative hydroxymethylpyrimidine transporter CytX
MRIDDSGPFALACVWFGAAVSMAEIATGALLADGEPALGMAAIVAGHLFGAVLLFTAAWISWKRRKNAIEVCSETFGAMGPRLFGILNVVQLVGWTAVMIVVGARSMDTVAAKAFGIHAEIAWRLAIGVIVLAVAITGFGRTGAVGVVSVAALACLCALLSAAVFFPGLIRGIGVEAIASAEGAAPPVPMPFGAAPMPFGAALELAVIMPLSWLPLVGDYVNGAKRGRRSCLASAIAYTVGSVWMYSLGLFSARLRGNADPVGLLGGAWALPALAVVLLSTVTTAFLDVRSAGISLSAAAPRAGPGLGIIASGILGIALALVAPVERYETFLAFIGSVFAPLYAVIFTEGAVARYIPPSLSGRSPLQRVWRSPSQAFAAFGCWAAGVVLYTFISSRPTPLGASIPVMATVSLAYCLLRIGGLKWKAFRASKA